MIFRGLYKLDRYAVAQLPIWERRALLNAGELWFERTFGDPPAGAVSLPPAPASTRELTYEQVMLETAHDWGLA